MVSKVGLAVLAAVDLIAIQIRVVREPHRVLMSFSADRRILFIRLVVCLPAWLGYLGRIGAGSDSCPVVSYSRLENRGCL